MKEEFCRSWCWLLVLAACTARGDWSDCKPLCYCKWVSGKKTATCTGVSLRKPPMLSTEIQVLDLHDNNLISLPKVAFASIGLLNLQRINLKSSQIKDINEESFRDLRILVELDLSDNNLTSIPQNIFKGNERLRLVVFSGNPLTHLRENQFSELPHLKYLDFQSCHLQYIHPLAFHNLQALETIDLRKNKLTYLSVTAMELPALKALFLSGNPWNCDCFLKDFRKWFLLSNLGNEELDCAQPKFLRGKLWKNLEDQTMGCAPEIKTSSKVIRSEVGSELTFGCVIRGDPQPEVVWLYDGNDIINFTLYSDIIFVENADLKNDDEIFEEEQNTKINIAKWYNITFVNVTANAAGEWTCRATNAVGQTSASINIVLPRARAATARTAPAIPTVVGAIGGALGALSLTGFVAAVVCWRTRRKRLPPSRSFTDQEKKLLDVSLTAGDRSSADIGSPTEFEMLERSPSVVGDDRRPLNFEPVHITIEGCPTSSYPPPPPEFALPSTAYGNIYISVQVAGVNTMGERYPDLLGGGATLPRRARACCEVLAYDNMGPRVTATGSSTWSLPGSDTKETITLTPAPPPEFVSL